MGRQLFRRYGSSVAVEYVDVFSPQMEEHPQELSLIMRGNVPLPIISVNGKPRFAGSLSYEVIVEELHKLGVTPQAGRA